jgi:hypothetical protein
MKTYLPDRHSVLSGTVRYSTLAGIFASLAT